MRALVPATLAIFSIMALTPLTVAERPNVLLITADDLGNQLSCYGEHRLQTPRLDQLAAQGVRFTRAFVTQSSCSSSRSSILTGLYPHQNGQYGLAHLGFSMHAGQTTLPAFLKKAGYRTGIIGKLHVEPAADFPFDWKPNIKGWSAGPTRNVRWVAEQGREFFASVRDSQQPFFFYVNYFEPHGPYTPGVRQVAGFPERPLDPDQVDALPLKAPKPEAKRRITALIYDCISRVDTGTGLLLDELESAGLTANTLVVFLGDNGACVRHGKCSSYEPGVQVPLLIRWPNQAKAGQVRNELVSMVDLMPTILEAAGIEVPKTLAGRSLQPLLRGRERLSWRTFLFTEMNFHTANMYRPQRTVRDDQFKLLLDLAPPADRAEIELYDLQNDPGETNNLADDPAYADHRRRLEIALQEWRQRTDDPLLDAARLKRWTEVAAKWRDSAPRLDRGPAPNVARVPPGELDLLK